MIEHRNNKHHTHLFFDLEITGHHLEFVAHIIRYACNNPSAEKFIFLINKNAVNLLGDYHLPDNWRSVVTVESPDKKVQLQINQTQNKLQKAGKELELLKLANEKYQVDKCYIMALNKYQFALGGKVGRIIPCKIRGILFNPLGKTGKPIYDVLLGPRKKAQIFWMLRNRNLERIFLLNDDETSQYLNKIFRHKNLFQCLPDPVQKLPSVNKKHGSTDTDSSRVKFLLFGALSERKGIFTVLDALELLSTDVLSKLEVIFAGKVDMKIKGRFVQQLERIKNNKSGIVLTLIDNFLSNKDVADIFSETDFVLAPYIGSQASSGIIGHAALHKKPVIGPDTGLISRLIQKYDLGIVTNTKNSKDLSSAMQEACRYRGNSYNTEGMEMFVQERTPEKFVKRLFA